MASPLLFMSFSPPSSLPIPSSRKAHLSFSPISLSIKTPKPLSFSKSLSGFPLIRPKSLSLASSPMRGPSKFTVSAAKGYKMKTHKASAKRFRVTGRGKIVRRRAGKQHLLAKKNTKRKLRLSKMYFGTTGVLLQFIIPVFFLNFYTPTAPGGQKRL